MGSYSAHGILPPLLSLLALSLISPSHSLSTRNVIADIGAAPNPPVNINWFSDPMTEEEAEDYWGKQAIAMNYDARVAEAPQCMVPRWSDLDKSIHEVIREHPDEDLSCYFGYHGNWLQGVRSVARRRSFGPSDTLFARPEELEWGKAIFSDGTEVTMHIDEKSRSFGDSDDMYCYALGWLRNQGQLNASVQTDWDAWNELARQQCKKLNEEYAFTDSDLTMRLHCNGWGSTAWRMGCSVGFRGDNCNRVSKRELVRHAYDKCLMGAHAVGREMAYCINRACLLPNNRIGHHKDCGPNFPFDI